MTGRSSRWFTPEPQGWEWSRQVRLMLEDFDQRIVPYRANADAYRLSTDGIPTYDVARSMELEHPTNGVDGFVRSVSNSLIANHEVWLEITFANDEQGRPYFRVFPVLGVRRESSGRLVQEVPIRNQPDLPDSNRPSRTLEIELDPAHVIGVSLPKDYPANLIRRVINQLVEVDDHFNLLPDWVKEQMAGHRRDVPRFDSALAVRTERLRTIQAASPIGWTAREIFYGSSRHLGDYYYYWRELRFLHFRSSLRACAEEILRQVLTLAGPRCGFTAQVTAVGVYTPAEVAALICRFESGEILFTNINDILFENLDSVYAGERQVV